MASATGSPSSPELATALHRLRSTLARMRAELEMAATDGVSTPAGPIERLMGDVGEALELLGEVESAALSLVRVLVIDDDARLGELTARGLRRKGYDAVAATNIRPLRPRELLVLDLGVAAGLDPAARRAVKDARPIILTGAADAESRRLAAELEASAYLVKPADLDDLVDAIKRRAAEGPL